MTDIITFLDNIGKLVVYIGEIFVDSIVIYKLVEPQIHLPLQVRDLIIVVFYIPPTMIQQLSRQLFQLSELERILFLDTVEVF